jgi:hypothetical protein
MGFNKSLTAQETIDWLNSDSGFIQINQWVVDYFVENGFSADDLEIINTITN